MEEKELQLQSVSREREDLRAKLGQLQALFASYLQERGGGGGGGGTASTTAALLAVSPPPPPPTTTSTQPSSSASSTSSFVLLQDDSRQHKAKAPPQENGEMLLNLYVFRFIYVRYIYAIHTYYTIIRVPMRRIAEARRGGRGGEGVARHRRRLRADPFASLASGRHRRQDLGPPLGDRLQPDAEGRLPPLVLGPAPGEADDRLGNTL